MYCITLDSRCFQLSELSATFWKYCIPKRCTYECFVLSTGWQKAWYLATKGESGTYISYLSFRQKDTFPMKTKNYFNQNKHFFLILAKTCLFFSKRKACIRCFEKIGVCVPTYVFWPCTNGLMSHGFVLFYRYVGTWQHQVPTETPHRLPQS